MNATARNVPDMTNVDVTKSPLFHKANKLKPAQIDIGNAFGLDEAVGRTFWGFEHNKNLPGMRTRNQNYVHRKDIVRDAINWWRFGGTRGLYLKGPTGSGKSEFAYELATAVGLPVLEVTMDEDFEFRDLVGVRDLDGPGRTTFRYGPLPMAMGAEGFPGILVVNELPNAKPGVLNQFFEILTGQPLTIAQNSGEQVDPLPGFRVIATGNAGLVTGDETHQYFGARPQNLALVDRFTVLEMDYPSVEIESKILKTHPVASRLPDIVLDKAVELANSVRNLHLSRNEDGEAIEVTMSTRSLVYFCENVFYYRQAMKDGISPYVKALQLSVSGHASDATKLALEELVEGQFGDTPLN